jgi:hypothetical protein
MTLIAENVSQIKRGFFGPDLTLGNLRMGDLVAVCNLVEYMRKKEGFPTDLSVYIEHDALFPEKHVYQFHDWLCDNTDYISNYPGKQQWNIEFPSGTDQTYPNMVNLWNIRKDVKERKQNIFDIDDLVKFENPYYIYGCIVIAPLMDAPYNANRNWSLEMLQKLVARFSTKGQFYKKVILSKQEIPGLDRMDFKYSHNFYDNLYFVQSCNVYIGGDTGFSHFCGAMDYPDLTNKEKYKQHRYYLYPKETYGTTYPFHWKTRGKVIHFDDSNVDINKEIVFDHKIPYDKQQ